MEKKLSIIISNRNDTIMLSVTLRSCIEGLKPLGLKNCEIIIVDNSDPLYRQHMPTIIPRKYLEQGIIRYYLQDFPCLFSARQLAAEKAKSNYICCLDSHMLVGYNMFLDLYKFMEHRKYDQTLAFAHAPINWAHQHHSSSRHDRDMSKNELGDWNLMYNIERTITWKGMPWICKRDFFLNEIKGYGALSDHKISWGGGDIHIGVKPWMLGFKNWAVPTSPGIHIGPYPKLHLKKPRIVKPGPKNLEPYRTYNESGNGATCIGFLISCYVLGGEEMMLRNKDAIKNKFSKFIDVDKEWETAKSYGEDEKRWLDSNKIMSFEELLKRKPWDDSSNWS